MTWLNSSSTLAFSTHQIGSTTTHIDAVFAYVARIVSPTLRILVLVLGSAIIAENLLALPIRSAVAFDRRSVASVIDFDLLPTVLSHITPP
jgi:hypothetical protein